MRRSIAAWLDSLLGQTGLADRRKHRPSELSGGQQQRVAIARSLVTRPTILFADEPTGNLDSKTGGEILELLRASVDAYGQTTVMVTHEARAASIADRILFLEDGLIVKELPRREPAGRARGDELAQLMISVALRGMARRKLRTALTAIAIVLGVALITGTYVLTDSIKGAFGGIFTQVYQGTDATVTGQVGVRPERPEQHDGAALRRSRCCRRSASCPTSPMPLAASEASRTSFSTARSSISAARRTSASASIPSGPSSTRSRSSTGSWPRSEPGRDRPDDRAQEGSADRRRRSACRRTGRRCG